MRVQVLARLDFSNPIYFKQTGIVKVCSDYQGPRIRLRVLINGESAAVCECAAVIGIHDNIFTLHLSATEICDDFAGICYGAVDRQRRSTHGIRRKRNCPIRVIKFRRVQDDSTTINRNRAFICQRARYAERSATEFE